ncbi:MAG: class I SAM-dependent methyltransferase [Anaerolineae bacterium]|nr:class I SAM-dependent methyltransferase [Anaerolineae bacterium]
MMTFNDPDNIPRVCRYYNDTVQEEWERLEKNRMEYAISSFILNKYLPSPPGQIADIGGGPGRYALDLAAAGYHVHLLDLSPGNIAFARTKAVERGVALQQATVFDASQPFPYPDNHLDALLMMGPLYHLVNPDLRQKAVGEAFRVLKPGGVVFTSFCTMFGALQAVLMYNPQGLEQEWATMQHGINNHQLGFTTAWFARPEEVILLMEPFETLAILNTEGFSNNQQEVYRNMEPDLFQKFLERNLEFALSPYTLGAGNHILFAGRKPDASK